MHWMSIIEGEQLKSTKFSPVRVDFFIGGKVLGNDYPQDHGLPGLVPGRNYRVVELHHTISNLALATGATPNQYSFIRVEEVSDALS